MSTDTTINPTTLQPSDLMRVHSVATLFGVSIGTVRNWISNGRIHDIGLKPIKVGRGVRFHRPNVEAVILTQLQPSIAAYKQANDLEHPDNKGMDDDTNR
jgi:excisionase family DNA binding protein